MNRINEILTQVALSDKILGWLMLACVIALVIAWLMS